MTDVPQMWRGRAGRRPRSSSPAKRVDRETPIQRAVVDRLRFELPGAIVHHSPNEVPLDGEDVKRAVAKAKRNGMVPGFPDVVVVLVCRPITLFFEVKSPTGRETAAQRDLREVAVAAGHHWAVVRSQEDVVACLDAWGVRRRGATRT